MRLPDLSPDSKPILKWVLPMVVLFGTTAFIAYVTADTPIMSGYNSQPQMFGTLLMMSLLPGYLIGVMILIQHQSLKVLNNIKPLAEPGVWQKAHHQAHHLVPAALPLVVIGAAYGVWQNHVVIIDIWQQQHFEFLDVFFIGANTFLWATIGLTTCWRLPAAWALSRVGRTLEVNLYNLSAPRALANLATKDVLMVAGGMAFMPLQSLDAEFRWGNYQGGFFVGIPTAIILLLAPLLGLRANIAAIKNARVEELHQLVAATDSNDISTLESISAHIERIKNTSNWGLDLRLLTKVFAYLIIPPLAWVGAALVENLVESLY